MFGFVKKIVSSSLEKPKLLLAIVLVLLPVVFRALLGFFVGASFDPANTGFLAATEIALWLVSGIGLYAIIYIFKGSDVKGKLSGILTSMAYPHFFLLISTIVFTLVVFLLVPEYFAGIRGIQGKDTQAQIQLLIESLQQKNDLLLFGGFGLVFVVMAIVFFLTLYLFYSVILLSSNEKPKRNLFAFIVFILFRLIIGVFL